MWNVICVKLKNIMSLPTRTFVSKFFFRNWSLVQHSIQTQRHLEQFILLVLPNSLDLGKILTVDLPCRQKDKDSTGQTDKRAKGQNGKRTKGKKNKRTKGQKDQRTKGQKTREQLWFTDNSSQDNSSQTIPRRRISLQEKSSPR